MSANHGYTDEQGVCRTLRTGHSRGYATSLKTLFGKIKIGTLENKKATRESGFNDEPKFV